MGGAGAQAMSALPRQSGFGRSLGERFEYAPGLGVADPSNTRPPQGAQLLGRPNDARRGQQVLNPAALIQRGGRPSGLLQCRSASSPRSASCLDAASRRSNLCCPVRQQLPQRVRRRGGRGAESGAQQGTARSGAATIPHSAACPCGVGTSQGPPTLHPVPRSRRAGTGPGLPGRSGKSQSRMVLSRCPKRRPCRRAGR